MFIFLKYNTHLSQLEQTWQKGPRGFVERFGSDSDGQLVPENANAKDPIRLERRGPHAQRSWLKDDAAEKIPYMFVTEE